MGGCPEREGSIDLKSHAATRSSGLTQVIAPEIRNDPLARLLERLAADPTVRTILEEGSSSGDGSTDAFVKGALRNPGAPDLHCVELSKPRFDKLVARHGARPFVHCHNLSSVSADRFATLGEVEQFCAGFKPWLRRRSLKTHLRWLEQDLDYLREVGGGSDGIREVKAAYGVRDFDLVLIDGSEFSGRAVLEDLYGARFIVLDDIRAMKNYGNHDRLRRDPEYACIERSWWLRNGYAAFERSV